MKILLINKFLYPRGGDAICMISTGKLLSSRNHKVVYWGMNHPLNPDYPYKNQFVTYIDLDNPGSTIKRMRAAFNLIYSLEAKKKLEKVLEDEKPDIVHLHNFAHQISPSILHVLKRFGIPSVMTMHDYKLVCPVYSLLLNGSPCERCRGGKYYQCFINSCVKNSRIKSLLSTIEMYTHHKLLHIYELIKIYISPSRFLKNKAMEMGFQKKIVHLPNFVNVEDFTPNYDFVENSIVYVGRLSYEKGLLTLIEAVRNIKNLNLKVIGEGPQREDLESRVESLQPRMNGHIHFLGYKSGGELINEIRNSLFLVLPSESYENNPLAIIEGYALGKPVIGSKIGGIPELVKEEETGLCFEPGNVEELGSKIEYLKGNPRKIKEMGRNARTFVEQELNADRHYQDLISIYSQAMDLRSGCAK